jgi:hypothetical protein
MNTEIFMVRNTITMCRSTVNQALLYLGLFIISVLLLVLIVQRQFIYLSPTATCFFGIYGRSPCGFQIKQYMNNSVY